MAFAIVVASCVGVDQLTKADARASLPLGDFRHAAGPLFFRHAENPGIALGTLPAGSAVPVLIGAVVVALLLAFVAWAGIHPAFAPGCAFAVAGCLGNLVDRLARGSVTDFLAVAPVPVFNVADAFILLGFMLMVGASLVADTFGTSSPAAASGGSRGAAAQRGLTLS